MNKKLERWLRRDGLALIAGWRRRGADEGDVAVRMGIPWATLKNWAKNHEEIATALAMDGETADFMVEEALFQAAQSGDKKALEMWLKHRENTGAAKNSRPNDGANYTTLAAMIRGDD